MHLARVTGTVTATSKDAQLSGRALLICELKSSADGMNSKLDTMNDRVMSNMIDHDYRNHYLSKLNGIWKYCNSSDHECGKR